MPDAPYLAERQTEYWTSREIEIFLLDAGYDIMSFPLTQKTEAQIPSDFVFIDNTLSKIFGVQYKALYHNAFDHWKLDKVQHARLRKRNWVFYFVSELKSSKDHRAALHYTRIYEPRFRYRKKLSLVPKKKLKQPGYMRWRAFFEGFKKCKYGVKISTKKELEDLLREGTSKKMYECDIQRILDIFVVNFDA